MFLVGVLFVLVGVGLQQFYVSVHYMHVYQASPRSLILYKLPLNLAAVRRLYSPCLLLVKPQALALVVDT